MGLYYRAFRGLTGHGPCPDLGQGASVPNGDGLTIVARFHNGEQILKPVSMRRSLVLGDESAHHPFLQTLPPHVRVDRPVASPRHDAPALAPKVVAGDWLKRYAHAAPHMVISRARHWRRGLTMQNLREFLLAYCACFVAVVAFIA